MFKPPIKIKIPNVAAFGLHFGLWFGYSKILHKNNFVKKSFNLVFIKMKHGDGSVF